MAGLENLYDVAVIGGGLSGLTAAVYLAAGMASAKHAALEVMSDERG
ncbi:hypothetical protein PghCCS26_13620 [Paenibacillus glycanilyticus]|uniref:Uncharacterized protein n=1 Tax=Paenibacillus glycanilyticus TaxID=126569 RepID=A0ABQ6NJF1_9BACL|nr:hypothetical protein [Paenibacillus glycanilyticus]GMK44235.1 hypothetical protein PghCCS26_13620 [Paenibacillus glycanilyticus]